MNPKNNKNTTETIKVRLKGGFYINQAWHSRVYIMFLPVFRYCLRAGEGARARPYSPNAPPPFTADFSRENGGPQSIRENKKVVFTACGAIIGVFCCTMSSSEPSRMPSESQSAFNWRLIAWSQKMATNETSPAPRMDNIQYIPELDDKGDGNDSESYSDSAAEGVPVVDLAKEDDDIVNVVLQEFLFCPHHGRS